MFPRRNVLAAERKRLQDDLQMHTQQERLFSSILESVSLAKDEDKAIRTVLQTLGQKLNAELCYVYSYDYEQNLGILGGLWNSDRAHDISHLPPLKIDPDAIWFRRLKSGCLIAVDDLSDPDMEIVAGNWRKEPARRRAEIHLCGGHLEAEPALGAFRSFL